MTYDASIVWDTDEDGEHVDEVKHVVIHHLGTIDYYDVWRFDWKEEGKFNRKVASLSKKGDVIELVFGDDTINCCLVSKVNLDPNARCKHVPTDW